MQIRTRFQVLVRRKPERAARFIDFTDRFLRLHGIPSLFAFFLF